MPPRTKTETAGGGSHRLMKALSHPLRQRILVALNERESSPNEIAGKLGEPLGNVSYHVKVLESCEAIELARTAQVRGAIEHFYRATSRPQIDDDHWSQIPLSVRRSLFDGSVGEIWEHLAEAANATGFDGERAHVSWTPLDLDAEAYDEVADLLAATLDRVIELQAESVNRMSKLDDADRESEKTEVVLMHFGRGGE